eukprot:750237-Prorocentrum_minimum.AAC.1
MYTGASCGTWISPRNQYVAHGACPWESWIVTTLVTPAFWTFVPLMCCTTHPEDVPVGVSDAEGADAAGVADGRVGVA